MAVPKFFEFFEAFLKAVSDGELHSAKDVRNNIANSMKLTEEDLAEMLPSGSQRTFDNRVAWARTYLDKAGLIETPMRGKYHITEEGIRALTSNEKIDLAYLEKSEKFKDFHNVTTQNTSIEIQDEKNETPLEILESAHKQYLSALASQLMDEVMKLTPVEFERLVVKLLLKMGYGSGIEGAGMVTQASNDGGIDGIIKEDQLGFSHIYIQAKQWSLEQTVGKPEIQKFVGALQGQQAQKGLFITTARFSSGAIQYANNLLGVKVVLVDGSALTKLMIKHSVGVSLEQTYEVKKIDSDFFAEEL
ncbi:restriction endonuclease [Eubacterium coprostanoligenes]|uniref:Restriction system protein n=1 Tax=Eubacterium coprostanoligenes TaxID=290054 RepID=A0A1T4MAH0_9FIRM|nr:restriction endonuclease [Eubacterium coprostanoligenes]SJZ64003.1 restriction system protein [Eubacterium coprostanoligenes]